MAVKRESNIDHEHFTQMLDLVPTNFYFDSDSKKLLREDPAHDSEEESLNHLQQTKDGKTKFVVVYCHHHRQCLQSKEILVRFFFEYNIFFYNIAGYLLQLCLNNKDEDLIQIVSCKL